MNVFISSLIYLLINHPISGLSLHFRLFVEINKSVSSE